MDVVKPQGDRYLVVDGQQRLTTLWEALGRAPAPGEIALVFDVEREEFVSRPLTPDELEGRPPSRGEGLPEVPLHLVLDAALLAAWLPSWMSIEDKRRFHHRSRSHQQASGSARSLILECTDEAALFSHGIDHEAREGLRRGDVETFFARRGASLRRSTEAFFARHTELERDDAPPIAALTRRHGSSRRVGTPLTVRARHFLPLPPYRTPR